MLKTFANLIIFVLIICIAWFTASNNTQASTTEGSKEEITSVLTAQAKAWNSGDINSFMTGYLKSPDISYTSGGKIVWGYEALLQRYMNKYGTKHDTMGKLTFSDLRIDNLGADNALCIGKWHLERENEPSVDGVYSLIFVRTKSGWKIIHDHTSAISN